MAWKLVISWDLMGYHLMMENGDVKPGSADQR